MLITMKPSSGFTIIELIITVIVLAILLTLGVMGMRGIDASARDKERQSDVETLARGLEQRYNRGNPRATATAPEAQQGSYPGTNEAQHIDGVSVSGYTPTQISGGYRTEAYPGTSTSSFVGPKGSDAWTIICTASCSPAGTSAQISAAFNNQDRYVYEPVDASGNVCCCGDCVRYNLYWKSEGDTTVTNGIAGLQIVKSKHR